MQQKNKNSRPGFKSGYTLIELLIVMGIIVILFSMAMPSMNSSRKYFTFTNSYEKVVQMVREARSYAVTGKARPDWTDYDQDTFDSANSSDLVTPAGYGVFFNPATKTVTMFADVRNSAMDNLQHEGQYDPPGAATLGTYEQGKDVNLEKYTIDSSLTLILSGGPTTIIYTPIFADTILYPALETGEKFIIFGASEGPEPTDPDSLIRHRCSKIHPAAGVPEVALALECPYV